MKARMMRTAALCAVLICVAACTSTVTPQPVEAKQASYDGAEQNSGVIAAVLDDRGVAMGWVVTARARDRYNSLVERFGLSMWSPAIRKDHGVTPYANGHYFMTNEAMAKFVAMAEKARMTGVGS